MCTQLYNIIAQKESKLNLQMAADQRRLAHASKRDSTSMKTISFLGAIFLPATLLASVFSMVFFNVSDNSSTADSSKSSDTGSFSDQLLLLPIFLSSNMMILTIRYRGFHNRSDGMDILRHHDTHHHHHRPGLVDVGPVAGAQICKTGH